MAPLEINISQATRDIVHKKFHFNDYVSNNIPIFPPINSTNLINLETLIQGFMNGFDDPLEVVSKTISADIFPRFQRSPHYTKNAENFLFNKNKV